MRAWALVFVLVLAGCTAPPSEIPSSNEAPSTPEPSTSSEPEPSEPEPSDPEPSPPATSDPPGEPSEPNEPPENEPAPVDPEPQGTEPEWGTPSSKGLRPGINMVYNGAGCTTSFIFHDNWTAYYMATAAHCVSDGEGCAPGETLPSGKAELRLQGGGTVHAEVAYHAWTTMTRVGETNAAACSGNDFALLRIPDDAVGKLHPASLHFQAPTALATMPTQDLWGYGASSLKFGVSAAHPKQGVHIGTAESGWSHLVYLMSPGIPGDSGGHIMTEDGQALGIASRVIFYPYAAANYYTDIAKSLAYMEQHEGWAPELVTWDDFNASLA